MWICRGLQAGLCLCCSQTSENSFSRVEAHIIITFINSVEPDINSNVNSVDPYQLTSSVDQDRRCFFVKNMNYSILMSFEYLSKDKFI